MMDLLFPEISEDKHWQLLKDQLVYTAKHSVFYQQLFRQESIEIDALKDLQDFRYIPLTTKEDLQRCNEDFLAVDQSEIIDHVTTSGTLGQPVNFLLNEHDLQRLAHNEYESFKMAGVSRKDVVQLTTTMDRRFMAGMAYYLGLRKLGAGIVRTGSGLPGLQWDSIARFKPKFLIAVPSFLLKMLRYAIEHNIDYKSSSVRSIICIGEPLLDHDLKPNALKLKLQELWEVSLFSTYASTEMATAFTECDQHKGNHMLPHLIHAEILDERGNPVRTGEIGELVVTPLQVESMPLIRYATGDMVKEVHGNCACGRKSMRIGPVIGRKKQMLKIKGTSLYPQYIQEAINLCGLIDYIIVAEKDQYGHDKVTVQVSDHLKADQLEQLSEEIRGRIQVRLSVQQIPFYQLKQKMFPKESRKPIKFYDLRNHAG